MAADPKIDLRVSASGTDAAAKAIGKVSEETEALTETTTRQADAAEDSAAATDAQAESLRRLEEASRQYHEMGQKRREEERRAQQELDVAEATRRRDAREAEAAAADEQNRPGVGSVVSAAVAGAAIAKTAAATAAAVRDTVREMQALKVASGEALDTTDALLGAVADTFDVIANPLQALVSGLQSLAGLDDLKASAEQAAEMERRLRAVLETRRELAENARAFSLEFFLQRERQEIDNQTAALQRQMQVLTARRALIDAQGSARDAAALRDGADVNDVASAAIQRQAEAAIAALEDQAVQAAAALERARAEEQIAIDSIVRAATEGRDEDAAQARIAAEAATNRVSNLTEDLRNLVDNVIPLQESEIRTNAAARLAEIGQNVGTSLASEAQKVISLIQAKAAEQGGVLSRSAADAMAALTTVIEDGVIRPEEIGQVSAAMQLLRNSVEARDTEIYTTATSMATTTQETLSLLRTLATREAQNRAELATVRRMVEDLQR
jgi:hypothetical protein